jgi:hypothetical protein
MFNSTEVKPHFINPRCFGEDAASWLAEHLDGEQVSCGSPFQEDWGWSVPIEVDGRKFFINLGLTEETSSVPVWLVWVESRSFLSKILRSSDSPAKRLLCERLSNILALAPEISDVRWSDA